MQTDLVIGRLALLSRIAQRKLRRRLARDRWGSKLLELSVRQRCEELFSAARQKLHATELKGVGLGGAVVVGVILCLGVKNWDGASRASPASAVAAPAPRNASPPFGSEPQGRRPAPTPVKVEPSAKLASSTSAPPAPPVVQGELTRIKTSYEAARQRCLKRLYESPEYKSATLRADELEKTVRQLRGNDPAGELILVSPKWIEAKSDLSRLTQEALKADPEVQSAESAMRARGLLK